MRQVAELVKPTADAANPDVPVIVLNATVPPGMTAWAFGVAVGAAGKPTVGVMVAPANWVVESATTYFTGDAVPENVGNGLKVTVPFAFTV